jgi:hypothetical protein
MLIPSCEIWPSSEFRLACWGVAWRRGASAHKFVLPIVQRFMDIPEPNDE